MNIFTSSSYNNHIERRCTGILLEKRADNVTVELLIRKRNTRSSTRKHTHTHTKQKGIIIFLLRWISEIIKIWVILTVKLYKLPSAVVPS